MRHIVPLLVASVLIAGPAFASSPPPPSKSKSDKVICRKEAEVGSRFARKRCHTAAQWAEMRRRSRELVEQLQQVADIAGAR
jgi:hypothetical protein